MAISGRHLQFVQAAVKMVCTDCVCSGAQGAPCSLAIFAAHILRRKAPKFVIARPQRGRGALSAKREEVPLGCNLGKAVAISPMAFPRFSRILRDCHVGLRPPRNDKLGGLAAQNVLQSLPTCKALATRKGHAANGCAVSAAAEAIGAAVLTIARASCWRVAGQGMPCPYNFI